jgi:hypothetical protein
MAYGRVLALAAVICTGCSGRVDQPPDAAASGAGSGGATSSSVGSATAGAGSSGCLDAGGSCDSLDLPTCGIGRVPFDPDPYSCDEGNRCCMAAHDNDECVNAPLIALTDGTVTLEGDTSAAADEHPELTCESPNVAFSLDQGQLYYRFHASAGRTYELVLSPSFYGFVYVFPAAVGCSFEAIQAACSSDGVAGMVSPIVNPGQEGESSFTPASSEELIVAVDGDTSPGTFTLTIDEI